MYALTNSLKSQFADEKVVSKDHLLKSLQYETTLNIDTYNDFLSDISANIIELMEECVFHRNYDTRYGDLTPLIMANALRKDIFIIEYSCAEPDRSVRHVNPTSVPCPKISPLLLFKCGDHYESCLFSGTVPHNKMNIVNATESPLCKINANSVHQDIDIYDGTPDTFTEIKLFRKTHKHNFIFVHVNINSYRHKFAPLQEILRGRFVDLLIISESKLDESFPNSQFNVEGYTIHRQDKSASSGGLILYIRADIAHRRMPKFECNCFGIESICLEVKNGTSKSLITSIYKHPQVSDSTFSSHISDMADKQFLYHDDLTFIGDMNCCPRKSDIIKSFCDIYDPKNLIVSPTCHKGNNPTLLDVILVSKPRRFAKTLNCECILSDFHNFVGAATKKHLPLSEPRRIIYRSYKHFDDDAFINDVSSAPFHVARIFDDVHDASWFTSSLLNDVIDHHAPCKSKLIKCYSVPYMNNKLRKALYKRNMVRNKFRKFGKAYWKENRIHRNNVVSIRKRSIENYFSKNCSRKDKTFWSTVSPFMTDKKNKNGGKIILQEGETTVTDNHQLANIFNDYFSNIALIIGFNDDITSARDAIIDHQNHPSILKIREKYAIKDDAFDFNRVSEELIDTKLHSINNRKSQGYENIPGKLLRLAHAPLAPHLTYLVNLCFRTATFANNLKNAELSPIHKKEDNLNKTNYRPVSVLTVVSKLHEDVMNDQFREYFVNTFEDLLCAYRKNYSCQSVLVKMVDDWKVLLDKNHIIGAIFMDLSKAFNCLPHGIITAKLQAYGLSRNACDLSASYLSNRHQRVKIQSSRSEWRVLRKGVPQGSILGPLLFNVFINDMFHFMEKCALYNYADDNSMSYASLNVTDVLSCLKRDCDNAVKWFEVNGMQANPSKFQFMVMLNGIVDKECISICINESLLKPASHIKVLGVTLEDRLTFNEHVSVCCSKAVRQLNALSRISRYLDTSSCTFLFNSFVKSNFNYCPMVWHFCGKVNNDKIEKIQHRALKVIYTDYVSSYEDLMSKANVPTMLNKRLHGILCEVFKSIKGINSKCLNDLFEVKSTSYSLRNDVRVVQPKRRTTNFCLRTVSYLGAKLWNDNLALLADTLDEDLSMFKSFLKSIDDITTKVIDFPCL